MILYLPGNFQIFKKGLGLLVALVHDTQSNNSRYNYARYMHKLYIFFFAAIKTDGGYCLYFTEKLKGFIKQLKSGLIDKKNSVSFHQ